jgi:hypothetical protein
LTAVVLGSTRKYLHEDNNNNKKAAEKVLHIKGKKKEKQTSQKGQESE